MVARHKGTPREKRALAAYINLLRATNTVSSQAMRQLDSNGESNWQSQFGVLEALYHVGPMCLSELARKILRTSGNLTMVVDNLEKSGMVKRVQSSTDRRYFSVEITDKGSKLISGIFPEHAAQITEAMSRLTPEEQDTLRELCRKLGVASE